MSGDWARRASATTSAGVASSRLASRNIWVLLRPSNVPDHFQFPRLSGSWLIAPGWSFKPSVGRSDRARATQGASEVPHDVSQSCVSARNEEPKFEDPLAAAC